MSGYFKILGVLIFVASLFGAFKLQGILDLAAIKEGNQMLSALFNSQVIVEKGDQLRLWSGLYMVLFGLGFGSLCYGVGVLLQRRS